MKKSFSWLELFPVMLGFFVMGFVDVVGIATNYVKSDFNLSDVMANMIPMMVFLWFAVCSLPVGILMGRIGRRNTVLLSMGITAVAMLLPFVSYSFTCLLVAFALLGIGNTILQVSLNPMVTQIISADRVASVLTMGQFVKAISSFLGPVIAGMAASYFGGWKMIFVVYAVVTLVSSLFMISNVKADIPEKKDSSGIGEVVLLLKDKVIMTLFVGILLIVAIDVGLNTSIPKLLMAQLNVSLENSGFGTSLYFASRTIGAFCGAFLLAKYPGSRILWVSMIVSVIAFVCMLLSANLWIVGLMIVIVGLACANVFSILFTYALQHKPERSNEVSALMIIGVSGGALIMPVMGVLSDNFGQIAGLLPLSLCMLYILWVAGRLLSDERRL